jgi:hypothetical protein
MNQNIPTSSLPVAIDVPIMDQEAFSQKIGISQDTVRGMVESKKLPSIKIGKRRFVNIAELTNRCLNDAATSDANK